jgi:hypothetical protein
MEVFGIKPDVLIRTLVRNFLSNEPPIKSSNAYRYPVACPKLDPQLKQASQRGARRGAKNFLEFLAGTDQRKTVTKVGSIKAQHLNTKILHSITMSIVV